MKTSWKSTPKWLLIPPAVAALLILGPLSMRTGGADAAKQPSAEPAAPTGERTPAERTGRTAPAAPRTPDPWQMGSALVGVLLLGGAGLFALKRLRGGGSRGAGGTLVALRQTLRLTGRQVLHVVEFDDRILLLGEHERGFVLLDRGRLPDAAADEATVLQRGGADGATGDDADDGAVPKDLVIPRPPAVRAAVPATQPPSTRPVLAAAAARLSDFRSLLQKAGR